MKETIDLLGKILTNILTALYEPFGFSFLLSFLAMFFYLYAYKQACGVRPHKEIVFTLFRFHVIIIPERQMVTWNYFYAAHNKN